MIIVWKTAADNIPDVNDVVMVTREGVWSSALPPRSVIRQTSRARIFRVRWGCCPGTLI